MRSRYHSSVSSSYHRSDMTKNPAGLHVFTTNWIELHTLVLVKQVSTTMRGYFVVDIDSVVGVMEVSIVCTSVQSMDLKPLDCELGHSAFRKGHH